MEFVHAVHLRQPRRPMALRDHSLIVLTADLLVLGKVAPNAISLASVAFSALAAVAILATIAAPGLASIPLFAIALLGIGLRGLCNVLDGLVAIEGGQATRSGALFNEIPDRLSDALVLVALGASAGAAIPAAGGIVIGALLGTLAASLALATAYVRLLGGSLLGTQSFAGPMAKQQRMVVAAAACIAGAALAPAGLAPYVMLLATATILAGSALTCALRVRALARKLH